MLCKQQHQECCLVHMVSGPTHCQLQPGQTFRIAATPHQSGECEGRMAAEKRGLLGNTSIIALPQHLLSSSVHVTFLTGPHVSVPWHPWLARSRSAQSPEVV